jgi:hypothetical protein
VGVKSVDKQLCADAEAYLRGCVGNLLKRHSLERLHPLYQRLGEIKLAVHRSCCDSGDTVCHLGGHPAGEKVDTFILGQGGINIEDNQ